MKRFIHSLPLLAILAACICGSAQPGAAQERVEYPQLDSALLLETRHRADHDQSAERSSVPWVVTGAVVGGIAGALWYARGVRDDGDYLFPLSVIIITGGGIGLGGATGFLVEWMTR